MPRKPMTAQPVPKQESYRRRMIAFRDEAMHLRDRVAELEVRVQTLSDVLSRALGEQIASKGRMQPAE